VEEDESAPPHAVVIRPYVPADAAATLAIFLAAVTETAAADYSPEQIQAWARPQERELSTWHRSMNARNSSDSTSDVHTLGEPHRMLAHCRGQEANVQTYLKTIERRLHILVPASFGRSIEPCDDPSTGIDCHRAE
jgi:hypothetical protein